MSVPVLLDTRHERMPYEELLPIVHQIRRAQAELR